MFKITGSSFPYFLIFFSSWALGHASGWFDVVLSWPGLVSEFLVSGIRFLGSVKSKVRRKMMTSCWSVRPFCPSVRLSACLHLTIESTVDVHFLWCVCVCVYSCVRSYGFVDLWTDVWCLDVGVGVGVVGAVVNVVTEGVPAPSLPFFFSFG